MSIIDILAGRKKLFRSDSIRQAIVDIEQEFTGLINGDVHHNWVKKPAPSGQVWDEAVASTIPKTPVVSSRFTISIGDRIKIYDTGGERKNVYIRVLQNGVTIYISHNPNRLLNSNANAQEGIPITSAQQNLEGIGYQTIRWNGEMWATSDTNNAQVDVESE
jgi:hypothetical protein